MLVQWQAVMPPEPAGQGTAGILISLDALTVQRAEQPAALEDAPVALRRIGWIGRPIILVGDKVAGRDLPRDAADREAWVRASIGSGAYAVVPFEAPSAERATTQDGEAVDQWRQVRTDQHATWLLTDRARQVGAARQAGLKVVLIGPADAQPRLHLFGDELYLSATSLGRGAIERRRDELESREPPLQQLGDRHGVAEVGGGRVHRQVVV